MSAIFFGGVPFDVLNAWHNGEFELVVSDAVMAEYMEIAARMKAKFAADIVALAKRAAKDGEPMMRSLEYAYPGRGYAKIMDEFLMGENLLVAPVVEKGATSRKVVIPPGRWLGDDGVEVEGPAEIVVNAPLKRLPYFKRISE
jgi:alpha-glucosidase (family GH31 glycosyl hydrolase)